MKFSRRILVVRLSALGDVAILEPVLKTRAKACKDCLFVVAAPPLLAPLFEGMDNVQFVGTKKMSSLKLYQLLAQWNPDTVADMHHVNRTIGMDLLFRMHGVRVHSIHKRGRQGTPSWQRYDEVLDRCGLAKGEDLTKQQGVYWRKNADQNKKVVVGVAPFAQHPGKVWDEDQMLRLLQMLNDDGRFAVKLFGGKDDAEKLEAWATPLVQVESLAGKMTFAEELERIAALDVMVSMDSANMHFASCLEVPVVSVWGATHPKRGFYGWRQDPDWAVQAKMKCRPCSKYGKKQCKYGDYRCMKAVKAENVMAKICEVALVEGK